METIFLADFSIFNLFSKYLPTSAIMKGYEFNSQRKQISSFFLDFFHFQIYSQFFLNFFPFTILHY